MFGARCGYVKQSRYVCRHSLKEGTVLFASSEVVVDRDSAELTAFAPVNGR